MSARGGPAVEFAAPERVEIVDTAWEDPGPEEVVVKTAVSAISAGTELLVYRGEVPQDAPADEQLPGIDGTLSYPIRYGYAAVGSVVAVGDCVDEDWMGRTVFGFNPHESHFRARLADILSIPDEMNVDQAAFLAKVETALNFMLDANPRIGERVAVFGQGVIGLLTTALASRTGAGSVIAIEPIESRRKQAELMGADVTIDPEHVDPASWLEAEFGGVDIAIEVSGDPKTLETAIHSTRFDGRVLVGSWYGTKRERIGMGIHFHRNRIHVESSQVSTIDPDLRGHWDRSRRRTVALSLLADIDVEQLVTHRIPVTNATDAYRLLQEQRDQTLQVLLTYQ